jgi:DNA processing protein
MTCSRPQWQTTCRHPPQPTRPPSPTRCPHPWPPYPAAASPRHWRRHASGPAASRQRTTSSDAHAAVVALLRLTDAPGTRPGPGPSPAELLTSSGDPERALRTALDGAGGQATLLPVDPDPLISQAAADIERWTAAGITLVSVLDPGYPVNLHAVHDRPALLFVRGELSAGDERSVAIVGSRHASQEGLAHARRLATGLSEAGYVVASGLAAGIDAAAHTATLDAGGRTLAVIGTGVDRVYPGVHASLQRTIAKRGAVISCFWPDQAPTRQSFPLRNGVMSGLTRATVIVEASSTSGTRVQARRALAHGRPVCLATKLLAQRWARELAERPNVRVSDTADEIAAMIERHRDGGPLTDE